MARSVFVSFLLEIHFDTATIFIYAFSPLQITVQAHGLLVLLSIIGIAVLIVIAAKFLPRRGMSALQRTYRNVSQWSIGVKVFLLISAFVFLLLALVPILQSAATRQKMAVWGGKSEYAIPLLIEKSGSQTPPNQSPWRESYVQCSDQQALLLIYSDDKAYYLLCKSTENSNEGYVFEVRREFGLSSVRFASAGYEQ